MTTVRLLSLLATLCLSACASDDMNGLGTPSLNHIMAWNSRTPEELEVTWLLVQSPYVHVRSLPPQ
ncbi:MAG: hypothetical protein VX733_14070 [Candidatus Latescibacterota bacterium]|nr:hypothetical protein [Candidatus Latescibacterota bacterium]